MIEVIFMAIVHCPECQKEISNVAKACPYCGYPIGKRIRKNRARTFLGKYAFWIVLSLITIAAIIFILLHTDRDLETTTANTDGNTTDATTLEIEAMQLYYDYFEKKYGWDNENVDSMTPNSNKYNVFLADLTHDGVDEMIVVDNTINSGEEVELIIYTCQHNQVEMIYFDRSTKMPRDKIFGLYYEDEITYLLVCKNDMWMTGGKVAYEVFYLSENGDKDYLINDMYAETIDPSYHEVLGPGYYDFVDRQDTILNKSKILFECGSGYVCQSDPKGMLSVASNAQPSDLSETSVFPLSVPRRLDIAEQEKLFHQAIKLLDSDRLKATMMYDFSKRFSLHWLVGGVVTNQNEFAAIYFDVDPQYVRHFSFNNGTYPVAVDRFSQTVLLSDGTTDGSSNNAMRDLVAVCSNFSVVVGLTRQGRVVCYERSGEIIDSESWYASVLSWTDIVAIDVANTLIVGLKSDGTVVAAGSDKNGQLNVDDWENIVAVSAGQDLTCGLKEDGTVITTLPKESRTDDSGYKDIDVDDWDHIIAISAGEYLIVG
ncbi:MAG: zinc ribbon domain-containing protein, partial [Petrimonas sp.]|nr:zinc ribbon domain-containing protein [Petrimonas sp.]